MWMDSSSQSKSHCCEVVLMIWSSLLMIAYNLFFPGFKRDVILNSWHCALSARSHPQHQMFWGFFCFGMLCYSCENIALNGQMFLILKPIVGVPSVLCLCFFLSPWTVSVLFCRRQDSDHTLKLHRPHFAWIKFKRHSRSPIYHQT